MFDHISKIDLNNRSWKEKEYLTFDVDWVSDEILETTINILETNNVRATFFVTHNSDLLNSLMDNPLFEIGIHPNFNYFLNGDIRYGSNLKEILEYYMKIVPDAVSIRNHYLLNGTQFINIYRELGIKYDVNLFIPHYSGIKELSPFSYWSEEVISVPFFWEDDINLLYLTDWNIDACLDFEGIKVFAFHPIHVFLNSEKIERYSSCKQHIRNYKVCREYVNTKLYGTRDFLIDLIEKVQY